MDGYNSDQSLLEHIEELVQAEHRLQHASSMTEKDESQLRSIKVEIDQYWDFLRQRRALREIGQDPEKAQVRPPEIVEKYEQ